MFDSIDENGSGLIEYQEFISKACDIKTLKSELNLNIYFTYSKVIFKSSNNNFNNLDYNLNNESANYNSNNISKSTKIDGRKQTKLKYHISSNSIISNNINNINNQINNYQLPNSKLYDDINSQIINNNYIKEEKILQNIIKSI